MGYFGQTLENNHKHHDATSVTHKLPRVVMHANGRGAPEVVSVNVLGCF